MRRVRGVRGVGQRKEERNEKMFTTPLDINNNATVTILRSHLGK